MTTELEEKSKAKVAEERLKLSSARMNVVVFMTLLIDLLGFTVILPIMPKLLEFYGKEGSDDLYTAMRSSVGSLRELVGAPDTPKWNSVIFGGFIGSLFSLLQFLASPFIGAMSDVYGRRPMLLLSMIGVTLSYVIWAMAGNFTLFVISRVIGGLAKGNVSLMTAVVADVYQSHERGKGMALIGIAFSLGFLLGPMIGAGFVGGAIPLIENAHFFVGPALFAIGMAALDVFYIFCSFQETLPKEKRAKSLFSTEISAFGLVNPFSLFLFSPVPGVPAQDKSSMRKIGLIYFLYIFIYSGVEYTLTFLTFLRFNYTSMQQGKMFFTLGLVMIIVQGGFTRRRPSGSEKSTAITGIFMYIPAFLLLGYSNGALALYTGILLFGIGSAMVVPSMTTMISVYGTASQKGSVMGVFRALGALARAFGPITTSAAYWSFGAERCYAISAVLMVLPLLMLVFTKTNIPQQKDVKATSGDKKTN